MEEERESIFIANKIYTDVVDFVKTQKGFSSYTLVRKYKIGYTTANIIIDKLIKEGLIEEHYGTYWVIQNN